MGEQAPGCLGVSRQLSLRTVQRSAHDPPPLLPSPAFAGIMSPLHPPAPRLVAPQELAKFEIDCRNVVINQVIFPEEGEKSCK